MNEIQNTCTTLLEHFLVRFVVATSSTYDIQWHSCVVHFDLHILYENQN